MLLEHPAVCCPIVELRQYTLHPGRRDTLVALFEREFLDTQEAAGIDVLGQFRDLDDPDRFTWLRGFRDMDARLASLSAFYGGPVSSANPEAGVTGRSSSTSSESTIVALAASRCAAQAGPP